MTARSSPSEATPRSQKLRQTGTKMIDAGGQLVLPGFVDCHIHFLDGSLSLGRVNLEGAKDRRRHPTEICANTPRKHPGNRLDSWSRLGLRDVWRRSVAEQEISRLNYFPTVPFSWKATTGTPIGRIRKRWLWPGLRRTRPIRRTARSSTIPQTGEADRRVERGRARTWSPRSCRNRRVPRNSTRCAPE